MKKSSKAFLEFFISGEMMLEHTVEEAYEFLKEIGRDYGKKKFFEDYKKIKEGKSIR